jgi:membrane-associated phospholipid phosphatase
MLRGAGRMRIQASGQDRPIDQPREEESPLTALASRPPETAATPGRGAGHLAAPLFAAVLTAATVAAIYLVFVRTSLGQVIDTLAMRGADVHHPKVVEVLNKALNGTTLVSLVLVCVVVAAIGILRKRIDLAVGAALMVVAANGSAQLLKDRLTRPNLDDFPAPNSFPSGHTAAAASVAFALILVLPYAVRGLVALIGAGYVTVIAVATVWAEWHRPSDTVAGLLIVLAWGALISCVLRMLRYRRPGALARVNRVAKVPLLIVGALTGVVGVLGMGAVILSERVTADFVSGRFAFLAGSACITAAVAAIFLIWLRLAAGDQPDGDL